MVDNSAEQIIETTEFTIPFFDCDPMNVVWHGNYVKYLEIGRGKLVKKFGLSVDQAKELGYVFPVISLQIKYVKPCVYNQKVLLTTILQKNDHMLVFDYVLRDVQTNDKLLKAQTRQMAVDIKTGESCFYLPDFCKKMFEMEKK